MYKATWKHRVRGDEVVAVPATGTDDRSDHYTIVVRDPRIHAESYNDLYVRGVDGWEPAVCFSRHGVGSVFREIAFDSGSVRMEFADWANQEVRNPRGMRLRFYVRPTLQELTAG